MPVKYSNLNITFALLYEGGMKSSSLAYNRQETRDKRLLDGDQVSPPHQFKAFLVEAHGSMDIGHIIRVCCPSVHGSIGCDQESFTGMWW